MAQGGSATGARSTQRVFLLLLMAWLVALVTWMRPAQAANPAQGPGGPILVLISGNANFCNYY